MMKYGVNEFQLGKISCVSEATQRAIMNQTGCVRIKKLNLFLISNFIRHQQEGFFNTKTGILNDTCFCEIIG